VPSVDSGGSGVGRVFRLALVLGAWGAEDMVCVVGRDFGAGGLDRDAHDRVGQCY